MKIPLTVCFSIFFFFLAQKDIAYVMTSRGIQLSVNGYRYSHRKSSTNVETWRCVKNGSTRCAAAASTYRPHKGKEARISIRGQHNHPSLAPLRPYGIGTKSGGPKGPSFKTYSRVKKEPATSAEPAQST